MESRISRLIDSLPTLTKDDVDLHDLCSICFVDFKTILDDNSSDPEGTKPAGLTILSGCKHVFCKNDLVQWIRSWHGTCPTCRHTFLSNVHPQSESEDESDGGEYVPYEHEDEFEDENDGDYSFEDEEWFGDREAFSEDENESEGEENFEEEDDDAMGLGPLTIREFMELNGDWAGHAAGLEHVEADVQAAVGFHDFDFNEEAGLAIEDGDEEAPTQFGFEEGEYSVQEMCALLPDWGIDPDGSRCCDSVADSLELEEEVGIDEEEDEVGICDEDDIREEVGVCDEEDVHEEVGVYDEEDIHEEVDFYDDEDIHEERRIFEAVWDVDSFC